MNNNNKSATPQLSVILTTPDNYTTIRKTVTCLRKQTARDKLELIIVCTSSENLNINETELEDLNAAGATVIGADIVFFVLGRAAKRFAFVCGRPERYSWLTSHVLTHYSR